ncbi:hypothetical protein [Nostoc sp.]
MKKKSAAQILIAYKQLVLFYNSGEKIIQAIRNCGYTNSRPPGIEIPVL